MNVVQHSRMVLNAIREHTDSIIVLLSFGKDSIVMLDLAKRVFPNVYPVYMYFVKGLEHVEDKKKQVEKYYDVRVLEYPHWMNSRYMRDSYMKLYNKESSKIKKLKINDIEERARYDTGAEYVLNGVKMADSLERRGMLNTYDMKAINWKSKRVFPLSLWSQKDVKAYIKIKKLPRPISYYNSSNGKTSGLGLNDDALLFLKEKYPDDFRKVLQVYPFADMFIARREMYGK